MSELMSEPILCINCKHYKRNDGSRAQYPHECWVNRSLVTGEKYPLDATHYRPNPMGCGPAANFFEPKE